ncbi:MAG: class I SAM-dependent methyltransferase [Alphaproteobacteria bacterium]|nr:class I SAM-dependent methyltransferase [Alphaproteobacteria bacterium]
MTASLDACPVCGGCEFTCSEVLWRSLINEWQLAPAEADYINRQQGLMCTACGSNLRSMALAAAICAEYGAAGTLQAELTAPAASRADILEINEAGMLTPLLASLPGHRIAKYPDVDIHALPFAEESFDVVLHSDTLEHVENPVHALTECRRVLRTGGLLAFTVPTVVERLTRSRAGLPPSFHGAPGDVRPDFRVQSEFGADVWTYVIRAGFFRTTLHALLYPAGLAITARK